MQCKNCGRHNLPQARFCDSCGSPLVPTGEPPAAVAEPASQIQEAPAAAVEYAGFWIRLVAALVDGIIIGILEASMILGVRLLGTGLYPLPFVPNFPLFFPLLLYFWLFTGLMGQTPGKMLLRLKVIKGDGTRPGLGCAALREIPGKFISSLALLVGYLWIAWDSKKQGWHDKIAATLVIRTGAKR